MDSRKMSDGYIVRCDMGDEVVSALTAFAAENGINSGTVIGIGAVRDVTLGYFDLLKKEYVKREFDGIYELLSLSGNYAKKNADTILHCHAVISDIHFNVYGGHLFRGAVAITGEFYIRPGGEEIYRCPDEATGLNLIKL